VWNFRFVRVATISRKTLPVILAAISRKEIIMKAIFVNFLADDAGATAIEYGLIAALIAVVIITGVTAVGTQLSTTFTNLAGNLK
jgi:pilus assembly protein Flp/PilA